MGTAHFLREGRKLLKGSIRIFRPGKAVSAFFRGKPLSRLFFLLRMGAQQFLRAQLVRRAGHGLRRRGGVRRKGQPFAGRDAGQGHADASQLFPAFAHGGQQGADADAGRAEVRPLVNFNLGIQTITGGKNFLHLIGGHSIQPAAEGNKLHQRDLFGTGGIGRPPGTDRA